MKKKNICKSISSLKLPEHHTLENLVNLVHTRPTKTDSGEST